MTDITIPALKLLTSIPDKAQFYVTDPGKEGHWYCDAADTTSTGDDGMVIVTTTGQRIKRITDGFINLGWFNVVGNGTTNDYAGIAQALSYKMRLVVPKKKYLLQSALAVGDYLNIFSDGGEFIFEIATGRAILVNGSVGATSYAITQPLARGSNFVVSSTLAAVVKPGDLIELENGQAFSPYPAYSSIYKGETKEVFRVSGDNVYFSSAAHDSYSTSSFTAKIINPCFAQIEGDFTITFKTESYNADLVGMQVNYGKKCAITARFNYATEAALRITSCFQANVRVWVSNATRQNNGYGVAVMNGTVESTVSGTFANCRHAVACVADNNETSGIPHHIKIHDIVASGGRSNCMIDAHGTAGLIEFSNIFCTGGSITDADGNLNVVPGGINIGCREAIIKGLTGDQLSNVISIRSDAYTEYLDVSDVTLFNSKTLLSVADAGSVIQKILIDGVRGNLTDAGVLLGSATGKTSVVSISNVHLTTCAGILSVSSTFTPPDEITLHNVKVKNLLSPTDVDHKYGVVISGAVIKVLRIENCQFEGFYTAIKFNSTGNVEQLISLGSVYKSNYEHILFDGNSSATSGSPIVRCKEFKSSGDHFSDRKNAFTNSGAVNIQNLYNIIEYAQVDAFTCEDDLYFFGRNSTVGNVCIGVGKGASLVEIALNLTGYEVLSGTITNPLVIRGIGTPEGAVAAKFSALYTRKDSPGGVYYKSTGSGNTGWVAL